MRVHHIGYMVKNIQKAIEVFNQIGYEVETETIFDEYRGIDVCFMIMNEYRVELVGSRNKESVIAKLQKRMGNSPYHICYEVDDIFKAIDFFQDKNFVILQEPHEAVAIGKKKVAFLYDGQIGMIELLEV